MLCRDCRRHQGPDRRKTGNRARNSNQIVKRRVVVTGIGIVSCLGHSYVDVIRRLRNGKSGVRGVPEWRQFGITSLVAGIPEGVDARKAAAPIGKDLLLACQTRLFIALCRHSMLSRMPG